MKSIEIAPKIYWVGHTDWTVRDFHGYQTHRGSTYNAYLIVDEKIALIDAVKSGYGDELLEKVAERVDPSKIDYIISNHTEPDHSSELAKVAAVAPQAELICSAKGKDGLTRYYGDDFNWRVVKTGDTLSLGENELQFIMTPMLHWPDSMFTYVPNKKLLFSMDAFGQHLASTGRFDEDVDYDVLMTEAKVYYANIIMHLGSIVKKNLTAAAGLAIETICPSHGIIWRKHIPTIIEKYQQWADFVPTEKVLVIYDSMWHSTEMMAETILEGVTNEGVDGRLLRMNVNDLTHAVTEIQDAAAVVMGSPTLNNNMLPTMGALLTYLKGLKPKKKVGFAFGSHGWSGGGAKLVAEEMKAVGIELVRDEITCQYKPDASELATCLEAGKAIGQQVKEMCKK